MCDRTYDSACDVTVYETGVLLTIGDAVHVRPPSCASLGSSRYNEDNSLDDTAQGEDSNIAESLRRSAELRL